MDAGAERDAHFTRRLEAFSDIVFGFSLSFLAGRLVVPKNASDVFGDPSGLIGFFVTFAALVGFWFLNHRMFRDFFIAGTIDNLMVFVELSGVALLPYALAIILRFKFREPEPLVLYNLVFVAVVGSNAVVAWRGFARRWRDWREAERRTKWRAVVVSSVLGILFALAIPFGIAFPHIGWAPYWIIMPLTAAFRRFYRGLPAFARDPPGTLAQPPEPSAV
jgi:uncharacterized membrane protein